MGEIHDSLDDPILQPSVPSTVTDYIHANGNGPVVAQIGYTTVALRPGESVTRTRARAYFEVGDARTLESSLRTGATTLLTASDGPGLAAGWRSMDSFAALTQGQVDDLRTVGTLQGSGASSSTAIYAAYLELTSNLPPPAPTVTAGQAAHGTGTSPSWSFSASPAAGFECRLERPDVVVSDWSACASARSYDLTAGNQPDAQYTFSVRAVDDLGVAGPASTSSFDLDRVKPAAPAIGLDPASPGTDPTVTFSFAAEAGSFSSCRLRRGAAVVSDWTLCSSGSADYDLAALGGDGTYTFDVHATDLAGNLGDDASRTYTLDRQRPDPPVITGGPPAADDVAAVSWSFTAEAGTTTTCRLERNGVAVTTPAFEPCSGSRAYDLTTTGGDGAYTFTVRTRDDAGNTSDDTVRTYALDRVAPAAPVASGGPPDPSNRLDPAWSFTHETGSSTECQVENAGTVVSAWSPCVSPRSYALGVQTDGRITFRVRATDAAGNTGPEGTRSYLLDQTRPATPVVTGGPPASSSDLAPAFQFTVEPGTAPSCRLERSGSATPVSDWGPCSSPKGYDLSGADPGIPRQADGTFVFLVRSTDPATNTSLVATRSFELDTTAPNQPAITTRPGSTTRDTTPEWGWTVDPSFTYRCQIDRGDETQPVSAWSVCTSPKTYALGQDGVYTFRVRASDPAGNPSTVATDTFSLDTMAPLPPVVTTGPTGPSRDDQPSYAFLAEGGAALECRFERPGFVVRDWEACLSPRAYDLRAGHPDAAYTFSVRATDAAGNVSLPGTRSYTLDRTKPAPPVLAGPAGDSNDDTPVWSFTGEPGTTARCALNREAAPLRGFDPCSSPVGYDLQGSDDTTYTVRVTLTDAAGNVSDEGTRTIRLDRVRPLPPVVTARPGDDTNATTLSWTYTTTGATGTQCRLERGATVVSDWSGCTSPQAYASQPEGAYVFRVRGTDDAGNVGDETADTTRVDRTKPASPTITGGPTGTSSDGTPAYTFTAETGARIECRMDRGATLVSDWTACSSPRSYTLGPDDGAHTFSVRATDAAGNVSDPATRGYTLDRVAPPAPTIGTRPAPSTKDDTPTWTFTSPDATTFRCRIARPDDTDVIAWRTCTSPSTFDISAAADGIYTLHVRASDIAANESTETRDSFALDRDPPAAPSITAGPTGRSRELAPAYTFTAEPTATTACRLERAGTGTPVSDWAACTSPRAYALETTAPDDDYTFRVRATDEALNTGADATRTYTLDRTKPVPATITAGPTGESADDTPTYAWSGEDGATAECRIERGTAAVRDWAACTSGVTFALGGESDGALRFLVRLTDRAGNVSDPAPREYTLDRLEPVAPTITAGPAADSTDFTPAFSFTAEAGAVLECRLMRDTAQVEGWTACASPRSYDLTSQPDGTYTFAVRARDAAGNQGDPRERSYTLDRSTPATPSIDARPGPQGNSRDPQWAFSTTESPRTFECRLMRGTTVVAPWGGCASAWSHSLLMQPDDTYTFAVRAVNAAGTRSDPVTDAYRLDTAKPAPVGISDGPAPDSTDGTPSWTLTAEPAATLECRLDREATEVAGWAPCTSPVGYDVGPTDGSYTLSVRATDEAGNVSDVATASYTLDRTTPAVPVLGATPPADGSATAVSWTFSTPEAGRTFECRVTGPDGELRGWSACTSPLDLDLAGRPDGTYEVEIRTVNAAGTRSDPVTDRYDLDRIQPAAPVIADAPAATTADTTPTWTFTAEAGARFACRIERADGTVARAETACASPETISMGGLADGDYVFVVHATDAAGNRSDDTTRAFRLDTTVPGPATIDARPPSPAADLTPEWQMSGDAGMALECRLTRAGTEVAGWATCASPHVVDLAGKGDGTYTLHLRQVNAAGTRGAEVTDAYALDAAAPAAPVITATPGETGRESTPRWAFTAEAGAAVECRLQLGGADVRAWAPCTSPRDYGLAGEPDGAYVFSVRAVDPAGNTGPAATHRHVLDRVAPEPPGITGGPGPLGNGRAPAWSFTAEAGAVLQCRFDRATTPLLDWSTCQSPRGFDLAGQADGPYTVSVRAVDAAGNEGLAATSVYELDTTPGAVQITGGPGPLGNLRAPQWTFAGEGAAAFECRLSQREAPVADWQPCTTPRRFDLAGLPDGVFRFAARATDPAGNVGPVADADYELDTTRPAAPSIDRRPASPGEDRSPTWRFSGEAGVTYSCRVERRSATVLRDWATCASPFTADLLRASEAEYRFLVRATDRAGNVGPAADGEYELRKAEPAPAPAPRDEDRREAPRKAPELPPTREADSSDAPVSPAPRRAAKQRPRAKSVQPARAPAPRRQRSGLTRRPKLARPRAAAPPAARPPAARPRAQAKERPNVAARALRGVANVVTEHPDKSVFPFSLILLVLGFLGVQNRIDRSDPKLALAPVLADPDMEFPPPPDPDPASAP
jgi:hypothetical protein